MPTETVLHYTELTLEVPASTETDHCTKEGEGSPEVLYA